MGSGKWKVESRNRPDVSTFHFPLFTYYLHVTDFESRVLADLSELKAHMRWLIGNGNPGRLQELEARVERHEAVLQRSAGIAVAAGVLQTLEHIAIDYLRLHYAR